jgi:hypothetical protein
VITSVDVTYQVPPDAAAEDVRLIEAVFEQLRAERPPGVLDYQVRCLEDGVSFVHVSTADTPDGSNPLPNLAASHRHRPGCVIQLGRGKRAPAECRIPRSKYSFGYERPQLTHIGLGLLLGLLTGGKSAEIRTTTGLVSIFRFGPLGPDHHRLPAARQCGLPRSRYHLSAHRLHPSARPSRGYRPSSPSVVARLQCVGSCGWVGRCAKLVREFVGECPGRVQLFVADVRPRDLHAEVAIPVLARA